jgi:hypothetical protein
MCSMSRGARRFEYTICTAVVRLAVFTVQMVGHTYKLEARISAQPEPLAKASPTRGRKSRYFNRAAVKADKSRDVISGSEEI